MAAPQERDWRESVLRSGEDSDVTVCVEGRDFHLHSLILRQRSPFFKVQLAPNTSWREAQTGRVQIQEASQKIFGILLPFIYSHRLDWNIADWAEVSHSTPPSQPETFQDVLDLLKLAEFLQLADFAEYLLASHRKELENMLDGELKTVFPISAGGERTGTGYREQAIADSIGAIEGFVKAALEAYSDHIPFFKELLDQRLAAYACYWLRGYWPLLLALLLLAEDYGLAKLSKSAMDIILGRGLFVATSGNFKHIFSDANVRFASEKWGGKRVVRAAWNAFNRIIPSYIYTDPGFPGARATMDRVVATCCEIRLDAAAVERAVDRFRPAAKRSRIA